MVHVADDIVLVDDTREWIIFKVEGLGAALKFKDREQNVLNVMLAKLRRNEGTTLLIKKYLGVMILAI